MFKANLKSIKLEIFDKFGPKLGKLGLKLEKWKKLELAMCSNIFGFFTGEIVDQKISPITTLGS